MRSALLGSKAVDVTGALAHRGPGPTPDEDSAFYWEGLRTHRLLLQQCANCHDARFPPMPGCPNCGHSESEVVEAAGDGAVYSWISVHRALTDAAVFDLPYDIAVVELTEGCRVVGRFHGGPPQIGTRVESEFVDHDEWTELVFRPRSP